MCAQRKETARNQAFSEARSAGSQLSKTTTSKPAPRVRAPRFRPQDLHRNRGIGLECAFKKRIVFAHQKHTQVLAGRQHGTSRIVELQRVLGGQPRNEKAISGSEHFFGNDRREIALFARTEWKSLQIERLSIQRKLEFGAARSSERSFPALPRVRQTADLPAAAVAQESGWLCYLEVCRR